MTQCTNRPAARPLALLWLLGALAASACGGGGGGGSPPPPPPTPTPTPTGAGKIGHIVVVIQENRSVDNLFHGFPGANTVNSGMWGNQQVTLTPFDLWSPYSIDHTHGGFKKGYDGGLMDGFGNANGGNFGGGKRSKAGTAAYVYVPPNEVQPYWTIASQFALSDETFESYQGPSFVSHLFMIAGQADGM